MMTFYIKYVFLCTSVLPEDGLCRPKHGGEIATTSYVVINEYMCN
jgi:hypothetical protein